MQKLQPQANFKEHARKINLNYSSAIRNCVYLVNKGKPKQQRPRSELSPTPVTSVPILEPRAVSAGLGEHTDSQGTGRKTHRASRSEKLIIQHQHCNKWSQLSINCISTTCKGTLNQQVKQLLVETLACAASSRLWAKLTNIDNRKMAGNYSKVISSNSTLTYRTESSD